MGLVSIGAFLISLDVMVVATALPTIRLQLDASLTDLEWTVNAYNLAFACLMLTGSALGDRFGRRRMYVFGLVLFVAASVVAALSGNVEVLLLARVVQGIAAAIALPLSLALLSDHFPPEKRGMAMGIWGGVSGLAIAAGPVVGGAITQGLSWQWIFWLNVPFGLVAAVLSTVKLRESHGPRPKLDIPGLLLVSAGLFALTWAAVRAPEAGWGSGEVIGSLVVGVLLVIGFLIWEGRAPYPMLPLEYFRSRGFTTANLVAFFQHFSLIGSLFFMAQMFQTGLGNDPLGTGLRLLVWTAMPMLVAPIAGGMSDKLGNRPFMVGGMLLQAIGLGWVAAVSEPGVGYGSLVLPLILAGIGISMCFPTVANSVMGSVPPEDVSVAAGANNSLKEVGGVFGVALLAVVFAANGSYDSPAQAISGISAALYLAAGASAVGVIAALFSPGKPRPAAAPAAAPVQTKVQEEVGAEVG
ncbi:MFS transporter [Catellatospora sp. NEAU-YM18]|nr:MFS transporter [Catellatospora tritici]